MAIRTQKLDEAASPDRLSLEVSFFGGHRIAIYLAWLFNICLKRCYLPSDLTTSVSGIAMSCAG